MFSACYIIELVSENTVTAGNIYGEMYKQFDQSKSNK